jgi:hypothetical protein
MSYNEIIIVFLNYKGLIIMWRLIVLCHFPRWSYDRGVGTAEKHGIGAEKNELSHRTVQLYSSSTGQRPASI